MKDTPPMTLKPLAFLALLPLAACASIVDGTTQTVSVRTLETDKAKCQLSNDKGTWYVAETPGSTGVHRAYGDMTVVCDKDGFRKGTTIVKSSTKGMAFGNVIFGGGIGAGVDMANGAAYDYPTDIVVSLDGLSHTQQVSGSATVSDTANTSH